MTMFKSIPGKGNYAVYKGLNDPKGPIALNIISDGLSKMAANQLAKSEREKRESSKTVIAVYTGRELKSCF